VEQFRAAKPDAAARLAEQHPELRSGAFPETEEAVAEETRAVKQQLDYSGPTGVHLRPVSGQFAITCHASPDAGWPTLRDFLAGTQQKLTVGMYDFTSAHILDTVEQALGGHKKMQLVLDHPSPNPTRDQTDEETIDALETSLTSRFQSAWALVRSSPKVTKF